MFKIIFSGRLEFGSSRSYNMAQRSFEQRLENFYRSDIILKMEEVFDEAQNALNVPRHIVNEASEKSLRNTIQLLEYISQFAVAGDVSIWKIDQGKVVDHRVVEPRSDKAAVQAYLLGRQLITETGREEEAVSALSRAIEKFERHAKAYERRGFVNYQLRNFQEARYDYDKSIAINPKAAEPYLGRALVKLAVSDRAGAIADLDKAIKNSIPLQPIYWQSRRIKADCHLKEEEIQKAIFELKLFTKRKFPPTDPNFKWRRRALYYYGKALMENNDLPESVKAFNEAMQIEAGENDPSQAELLVCRGLALQRTGEHGYLQDWKEAANRGSKQAEELLKTAA